MLNLDFSRFVFIIIGGGGYYLRHNLIQCRRTFGITMACILSLQERDQSFMVFPYLCTNKCFFHHKYANKVFHKQFALQWAFVVIEMALKSRSYMLDLDHVKLSQGIFLLLSGLIKVLLHQLSEYTFIVVKNTHQTAANLMFCLILPTAMVPWWFLGVKFIQQGSGGYTTWIMMLYNGSGSGGYQQDFFGIAATIRIGREMLCLPYAGFFYVWTSLTGWVVGALSNSSNGLALLESQSVKYDCRLQTSQLGEL